MIFETPDTTHQVERNAVRKVNNCLLDGLVNNLKKKTPVSIQKSTTLNYSMFFVCNAYIHISQKGSMNRIKDVLEEKGIKQIWLAEQLGKSYNIVNGYCNNNRQPSLEDLNRIANILSVDVRTLIISNQENK